MRRSRSIALLFMAAAPLALTACDDNKPTPVGSFASAAECRASGQFSDEQCNSALREAQSQHEERAPRYETREQCEAEHGAAACQPREQGGHSWFMPALAGFMIGRALSSTAPAAAPLYPSAQNCAPGQSGCSSGSSGTGGARGASSGGYYRTASGAAVSPGVTTMGASTAASTMRAAATPAPSSFSSVSRGGFGSRASSGMMGPTGRGTASSVGG